VGGVQRLRRLPDHLQAGGLAEQGQLRERGLERQARAVPVGRVAESDADQEGALRFGCGLVMDAGAGHILVFLLFIIVVHL